MTPFTQFTVRALISVHSTLCRFAWFNPFCRQNFLSIVSSFVNSDGNHMFLIFWLNICSGCSAASTDKVSMPCTTQKVLSSARQYFQQSNQRTGGNVFPFFMRPSPKSGTNCGKQSSPRPPTKCSPGGHSDHQRHHHHYGSQRGRGSAPGEGNMRT